MEEREGGGDAPWEGKGIEPWDGFEGKGARIPRARGCSGGGARVEVEGGGDEGWLAGDEDGD